MTYWLSSYTPQKVSHLISRITFKVFALILGIMILFGCYFFIVSYLDSVKNAENSEFQRIEGIVHTFSPYLEFKLINRSHSLKESGIYISESDQQILSATLYLINASNNLEHGISILIFDDESGKVEIIDQNGRNYANTENKFLRNLIKNRPNETIKIGLGNDNYSNNIFYAYPARFGSEKKITTYVFADEFIGNHIAAAKSVFYRQAIFSFFVILFIGFLVFRALNRIFKHEVSTQEEMREYVQLAETRNEELETLSFVLQKSENLILLADKNGCIEWLNESYREKNNYSGDELETFVGRELAEVSHYPKIKSVIEQATRTKTKVIYEAKSYDLEGREFWAHTTVTPILNKSGEVERLLFIDTDITRLKLAEKEIANLANFTHEHTLPLIRIQSDGLVVYANEASAPILRQWNTRVNNKIKRKSILDSVNAAMQSNTEKDLNLSVDNRIFKLRFFPVKEKDYVNIYGEDITELQIAEKEKRTKALKLEQHNLSITDSINYARKIQEAILPDEDHIRQFFKDSFALSMPKDIVSGDFFWIYEIKPREEYLLALADCTGHGVPGAMMSIIGHSLLNEIVEVDGCSDPAQILELLNKEVITSLRQKTIEQSVDGMDVSLVKIDLKNEKITFSGAYQQLYWVNGKLNVFKGDRQPIGGMQHDTNRRFTNHSFHFSKGDSIYLTSDGYQDQFGGSDNKKFLSRRLQNTFLNNHKYSMQAQSYIYSQIFDEWRGENEQIDDVSLLGIKF